MESTDAIAVYRELLQQSAATPRHGPASVRPVTTTVRPTGRLRTGVRRLDELLGGGFPAGSSVLLYGPPFSGKTALQHRFLLEGPRSGAPGTLLLTESGAVDMSRKLAELDPSATAYEAAGLLSYVDMYTRAIGEMDQHPNAFFLDDPRDLLRLLQVSEEIQSRTVGLLQPRLVIQSLSTLILEVGAVPAFRFLRSLLGRFHRRGGTSLLVLQAGMHSDAEVQTIKHLCSGMIQTREVDEKHMLRIEGLPLAHHPGWVEYEFSPTHFELTGSFAFERIRGAAALA